MTNNKFALILKFSRPVSSSSSMSYAFRTCRELIGVLVQTIQKKKICSRIYVINDGAVFLKRFLWYSNHVSALFEPLVEVGEVEGQEGNDVREGGSLWYDKYFLTDIFWQILTTSDSYSQVVGDKSSKWRNSWTQQIRINHYQLVGRIKVSDGQGYEHVTWQWWTRVVSEDKSKIWETKNTRNVIGKHEITDWLIVRGRAHIT